MDELNQVAKTNVSLTIIPYFSDQQGPITATTLAATKAQDYLLCGPPPMMKAIKTGLIGQNVKPNHIHFEEFAL